MGKRPADKTVPPTGRNRLVGGTRLACLFLIAATIAAYSNTPRSPFVFDDKTDIVGNRTIRHLWPPWYPFLVTSSGKTALHGRPVVNYSLAVNYAMGGLNTLPYHLTNLAIHALAGLALFGIARRTLLTPTLGGRYAEIAMPLALTIAAIWTLHPLQTQAVTYVVQRYESLMGLFYLLSLYCAIRSDSSGHGRWWAAGSVAACLASMGCKEVAVSIPLVILLYDRAFMAGSFAEAWRRRRGFYAALAATWVALAVHLTLSGGRSSWAGFGLATSPADYAMSQFGVILHYLRLSFFPYRQVFDYGWPVARTAAQILPGVVVVGGLLGATAYALVRWPMWGLLGAWFFLILAPTSSIMPIADLAFEHRMYLSLAAVVVAAVIIAYEWLSRLADRFGLGPKGGRLLRLAPALAVLVALGVAAYSRNQVYRSDWSVWYDTLQKAPKNPRAYCNLGYAYFVLGDTEKAIDLYRKSLHMETQYSNAHYVLGFVLDQQGQTDEAIGHYLKAIQMDPQSTDAHYNLAIILRRLGRMDEAIAHYRKALEISPLFANAHYNLGNVYGWQGRLDEAIFHYRKALEIDPSYAEAQVVLDKALAAQERRASGGSPLLRPSPFLPR